MNHKLREFIDIFLSFRDYGPNYTDNDIEVLKSEAEKQFKKANPLTNFNFRIKFPQFIEKFETNRFGLYE